MLIILFKRNETTSQLATLTVDVTRRPHDGESADHNHKSRHSMTSLILEEHSMIPFALNSLSSSNKITNYYTYIQDLWGRPFSFWVAHLKVFLCTVKGEYKL